MAAFCLVAAFAAVCIPLFSVHGRSAKAEIHHPKLFPFYYQTNTDALTEMEAAEGFPWSLRKIRVRVNRPVVIGATAIIRDLTVLPVCNLILPAASREVMWGDHNAVRFLSTYCVWIFLNLAFTAAAMLLCAHVCRKWLHPDLGIMSACILALTPIVILSLREIQLGAFEVLVIWGSLAFWSVVLTKEVSNKRLFLLSIGMGVLFLGKLAVSTFAPGALLLLLSPRRKALLIILPALAIPIITWIGTCLLLGIPFWIFEINDYYGPTLSRLYTESPLVTLGQIPGFAKQWFSAVAESAGLLHLPFFIGGCVYMWKRKLSSLLGFMALCCVADFSFYFALYRVHAVYALHSMVLLFIPVACGVYAFLEWLERKSILKTGESGKCFVGVAIILVMQFLLNFRVLPGYSG